MVLLLIVRYHGCCSGQCMCAPRLLRPIKLEGGQYGTWGNYADTEALGSIMATGRTREGRVARRARRREAMKQKREQHLQEKKTMKDMVRACVSNTCSWHALNPFRTLPAHVFSHTADMSRCALAKYGRQLHVSCHVLQLCTFNICCSAGQSCLPAQNIHAAECLSSNTLLSYHLASRTLQQ